MLLYLVQVLVFYGYKIVEMEIAMKYSRSSLTLTLAVPKSNVSQLGVESSLCCKLGILIRFNKTEPPVFVF